MSTSVLLRGPALHELPTDVTVGTDASVSKTAHASAFVTSCGSWGIMANRFRPDPCGRAGRGGCVDASELRAIWCAVSSVPVNMSLRILTDSMAALNWILQWRNGNNAMPRWYDLTPRQGQVPLLIRLRDFLQERTGITVVQWVRGHAGNPFNEAADKLARIGVGVLAGKITQPAARERAAVLARGLCGVTV